MIWLGICAWILPGDEMNRIKTASELGLDGIVLDFGPWTDNNPMRNAEYRRELVNQAKSYNMAIPTLALNALCQRGMVQPENETYAKELLKEAILTAKDMGIDKLQIPSFYDNLVKTDEDLEQTIKLLQYACSLGEVHHIGIGIENVFTIKQHQKVVEAIQSPVLASLYDTQNPWRMKNQDGVRMAEYLLPYASELHAKDSDPKVPNHVALGQGDVRFTESMRIFAEAGYEGWVQLESRYDLEGEWRKQITEDMEIIANVFIQ